MTLVFDVARMRSLAERLVAIPSVSPDPGGENRVIRTAAEALPAAVERGEWATGDGRFVLWAYVPGRTKHAVVMLAHADTVGVDEYTGLGAPQGGAIGFDVPGLGAWLLARAEARPDSLPANVLADLHAEARHPGTWLFGRGALDMKSAIAVGVEVLAAMAGAPEAPGCGVLLVVTPDEEHQSLGMPAALRGIREFRDARGLALDGVINLDYTAHPAAYTGAMGKAEVAAYVLGRPTHAGLPFDGVDAAQVAAALARRVAHSRELVDTDGDRRGPPPVTLRLRDLKTAYNAQTAHEAWVEFSVLTFSRGIEETLRLIRAEAAQALAEVERGQFEMAAWVEPFTAERTSTTVHDLCVLTWPELAARCQATAWEPVPMLALGEAAGAPAPGARGMATGAGVAASRSAAKHAAAVSPPAAAAPPHSPDARKATLERLRAMVAQAELSGPAIVLVLVPPYYPAVSPGDGPLSRAAAEALADERRTGIVPYYPLVSDACYVAWRGDAPETIAAHMPALGREYALPSEDARALDLDVVSLGPWGHDAHTPWERMNTEYAFERLPALLERVLARCGEQGRPCVNDDGHAE